MAYDKSAEFAEIYDSSNKRKVAVKAVFPYPKLMLKAQHVFKSLISLVTEHLN